MIFSESSLFTNKVYEVIDDEVYGLLQWHLARNPEAGAVIQGSGGIRKIRWGIQGKGKRGGARVVYYWLTKDDTILMIDIYRKSEKNDLTKREIDFFKQIIEEYLQDE